MDSLTEFAKMLKERENPRGLGIITGIVISPPPNIKIRLNEVVVLTNEHLIFSERVLDQYILKVETSAGLVTNIEYSEMLKEGNELILIPNSNEQTYFVIDRAVKL